MSLFHLLPTAPANPISYNLSGTSGSPVSKSHLSVNPDDAGLIWTISGFNSGSPEFALRTRVMWDGFDIGDQAVYQSYQTWRSPSTGWGVVYVRLTADSGDAMTSSSNAIDGTTWHALTEDVDNIHWQLNRTSNGTSSGVTKVEIATDSGGTDIVATGYYESVAQVTI